MKASAFGYERPTSAADLQKMAYFAVGNRPVMAATARKLLGIEVTPAVLADASAAPTAEPEPLSGAAA
jgi:hypothetical protein